MSGTISPGACAPSRNLDGQVTPQAFAQALKAGHAYVSYGPLNLPVGDVRHRDAGRSDEPFTLAFAPGVRLPGFGKAALISAGNLEVSRAFADAPLQTHVDFTSAPTTRAGMRSRSRISADARPTPIRSG